MCPLLRGDAPPLPTTELARLRDGLDRDWGHTSVPIPSGPLLVIRVPQDRPDLLRDLEVATDHLPPIDLTGYRGAVLVGDQGHLAVSIDMLHSLVSTRQATEDTWIAHHRSRLGPTQFTLTRLPSDAQRRLRVVIRVNVARVAESGEAEFDELVGLLPQIKAQSPGQCRPAFTYLVAHEDHVRIDGARFFTELEDRARRIQERTDREAKRRREDSYEVAIGHIARLQERRGSRSASPAQTGRTSARRYQRRFASPVDTKQDARSRRGPAPPARTEYPVPETAPRSHPGTETRTEARTEARTDRSPDPRFRVADGHAGQVDHLKGLLQQAGYEVRERLVVDEVPLALAAARPDAYPRRVLVTFHDRLEAEAARRILRVARGAGAELALAVTPESGDGVDRVTLATNLKVIAPEAVKGLRLD